MSSMKIPTSFAVFQHYLCEAEEEGMVNQSSPRVPLATKNGNLVLFADTVLSTLHSYENLRDSVVDTRHSKDYEYILMILNPEFKNYQELFSALNDMECVDKVIPAKKETDNGCIRIIKLIPNKAVELH